MLAMNNNLLITDTGVIALSKGCREIELLEFIHCPNITNITVNAVVIGCPYTLDVEMGRSGVTNECGDNFKETHPDKRYSDKDLDMSFKIV